MIETAHELETPLEQAVAAAKSEAERAARLWPRYNSPHEAFAILLEEVDELKAHVWKHQRTRDLEAMRREAVQVAAVALRFVSEVCDIERGRR